MFSRTGAVLSVFTRHAAAVVKAGSPGCLLSVRGYKRSLIPTLISMKHREKKSGKIMPQRRHMIEWDFDRELNAFCRRFALESTDRLKDAFLSDEFVQAEALRRQKLGLPELTSEQGQQSSSVQLAAEGHDKLREILPGQLLECYPFLPKQAIEALCLYLCSRDTLADVARQMGLQPLILREGDGLEEPSDHLLRDALLAVVATVGNPADLSRRYILVQLSGVDVLDVWNPKDAAAVLNGVLSATSQQPFEPRLIGETGRNTLESLFYVGVYANRRLLGKAAGSSQAQAIDAAVRDTLRRLFRVTRAERSPFEKMAIKSFLALQDGGAPRTPTTQIGA